ncbi:putative asparagine synthase [Roridomyces roridus]|uniref:Asparagine synthase n=1 Tax=Roridomyces roridus TaxID=1738132 RepID=A0AAD7BAX2_9AGAR|nr:putative asparagine synthase [Roridomyces roridus]
MCGLTAVFHPDSVGRPSIDVLHQDLASSLEIIKHRGPDSRGTYVSPDARVGLGHVRLAIIDLETGQQPMSDEDELIHCVVTGEIYDHDRIRAEMQRDGCFSFKTKSDSELVVQLYKRDGMNLLFSLRGEFAFVLYDKKRQLLFAARDRFGIKPLYYTVSNGRVLFASEMKAFMGLGWKAEWDLDSIVQHGDLSDERTVFKGAFKLGAGHSALCLPSGEVRIERYWDLTYPTPSAPPPGTVDEMISIVRSMLIESVRLRLRADVPLAIYLSGGIDSSCVAGIATQLLREKDPQAKVTAFTLAFIEDDSTDESPLARRSAAHIGADMHEVPATEAKLVDVLEESIYHSELIAATFHGAGKLLLSKAVREKGYKVVLSGEGSDEIFGGYSWFAADYARNADPTAKALGISVPTDAERTDLLSQMLKAAGPPQISDVYDTSSKTPASASHDLLQVNVHNLLGSNMATPQEPKMFLPGVVAQTGVPDLRRCIAEGIDPRVRRHSVEGSWHSLNVSLYVTGKTLMTKMLLNFLGDRNDMANSIESRVPFLDHPFVEYVNSLPPSLKLRPIAQDGPTKWILVEKWILREATKPFITDEIYKRRKIPFNPPPKPSNSNKSTLTPLQVHLRDRITQKTVERTGLFDWGYIEELLKGYLENPVYPLHGAIDTRARKLMVVLSFVVFQERFNVPTAKRVWCNL